MATVRNSAMEEMAGRLEELETEIQSYADQLAEKTQECEALMAELLRLRATLEIA